MEIFIVVLQIILMVVLAPLLSGLMRKLKNSLRMRKGQPVLQPYYNLVKYFSKQETVSEQASFIFTITPYIVFASTVSAFIFVPVFHFSYSLLGMGGLVALFLFLALGRFFLVLAGLDTASSFGGMGSSREVFISSLAEPVAVCAIAAVCLKAQALNLQAVAALASTPVWILVAAVAVLLVILAETSRIPVDNQETHLELTMVHEAMVLEYSGRSLALLELSAQVKQVLLFSVMANILWPFPLSLDSGLTAYCWSALFFIAKVYIISVIVTVIEVALAKMRLFRVVDFMGFACLLAILALVMAGLGV